MLESKVIATFMERVKEVAENEIPLGVNCPHCECDIEPGDLADAQARVKELLLDAFQDAMVDLREELVEAIVSTIRELFKVPEE